jgi:hypothetical protein
MSSWIFRINAKLLRWRHFFDGFPESLKKALALLTPGRRCAGIGCVHRFIAAQVDPGILILGVLLSP